MTAQHEEGDAQQQARRPSPGPQASANASVTAGTRLGASLPTLRTSAGAEIDAVGAIVTAARVGRILGRSGWRIARQLPGGQLVERQAAAIQKKAVGQLRRLVETPGEPESRAVRLIQNTDPGAEPLRAAMAELLERSAEPPEHSREYLFGSIISQLVPDEARILEALAGGAVFASVDVQIKPGGRARARPRPQLANASTVGVLSGVGTPENTPTYLGRLAGFGLIEFDAADPALQTQYTLLAADPTVTAAQAQAAARHLGQVRLLRRTVRMSALGRAFWAAANPAARVASTRGSSRRR